jgi:hypothetical protein
MILTQGFFLFDLSPYFQYTNPTRSRRYPTPGTVWIAEKGVLVEQKTRDDLPPFLVQDLQKVMIRTFWQ